MSELIKLHYFYDYGSADNRTLDFNVEVTPELVLGSASAGRSLK